MRLSIAKWFRLERDIASAKRAEKWDSRMTR